MGSGLCTVVCKLGLVDGWPASLTCSMEARPASASHSTGHAGTARLLPLSTVKWEGLFLCRRA